MKSSPSQQQSSKHDAKYIFKIYIYTVQFVTYIPEMWNLYYTMDRKRSRYRMSKKVIVNNEGFSLLDHLILYHAERKNENSFLNKYEWF